MVIPIAPDRMEGYRDIGGIIVGTPEMVREELEQQIEIMGLNYLIFAFYFGDIAHEHAMRSLSLFTNEVMPYLIIVF